MELVGALLAVRLARKIRDSLQMELEAVRYFTNSTAVLGMILRESATYQEFVGTRVSEIRTKSDPETEWFWIPPWCLKTWGQAHRTRKGSLG